MGTMEVEVTFFGRSCFRIKSKNTCVLIDPFSSKTGVTMPKVQSDFVLFSHDNASERDILRSENQRMTIEAPGEYEIGGVKILGLPGTPSSNSVIYEVNAEGLSVVHLGFLKKKLTESQIELLSQVDILLIPVGGDLVITPSEACEMVKALDPYVVIPMLFGESNVKENLRPVSEFTEKMGVNVVKADKKINFKKESLPSDLEIVLLSR